MNYDLKNKFKNFKPYINSFEEMDRAAVLIPIIEIDNKQYILFEVRSKNLRRQPSEISFPGGKVEAGETPQKTSIRETCEELGKHESDIDIITEMDLLITSYNYIIHPYLGYINNLDSIKINYSEVEEIFLVPLEFFLKNEPKVFYTTIKTIPDNDIPYEDLPGKHSYKFMEGRSSVLFYKYKNYVIWGMTAKVLNNFINYLKK